jgi:FHA domain
MATEEIELTFIRCPGCKSLVPAIASRCRMCGQALQKSEEELDSSKVENENVKSPTLENLEDVVEENNSVDQEIADVVEDYQVKVEENFEEDLGISKLPQPAPVQKDDRPLRFLGQANDQIRSRSVEVSTEESDPIRKKRKRRRKKKRPAEGGTLATNTENRFSTSSEKIDSATRYEIGRERSEELKVETEEVETFKVKSAQQLPVEAKKVFEEEIVKNEIKSKEVNLKSEEKTVLASKKSSAGELIGWFVTYGENKKGEAIEVRSGRFFISSGKVREDDMIVDHASISTPHCLVKSGIDGIQIQDLMSEAGTFVRKAGSKDYLQLLESARLSHGDSVKFGDYEVLVCIVPPKD